MSNAIIDTNGSITIDDADTFLGTEDLAKMIGCSKLAARKLMLSPGFPLIKVGKNLKVMKGAYFCWALSGNS